MSNIEPLMERSPLELRYKRAKHSRSVLNATFRTPGAPLGAFGQNWLGGGAFANMLRSVFADESPHFVQAREELKAAGFKRRPKAIDFDVLVEIETEFPGKISREDIGKRLGISVKEVDRSLTYLRGFVVNICGISVLSDWRGSVGIATTDLWAEWQSRMAQMASGISEGQKKQGLTSSAITTHGLTVLKELPAIHPILLGVPESEYGSEGAYGN